MTPLSTRAISASVSASRETKKFFPENASTLTASPYDDPESFAWVELATEHVPPDASSAAAFWYVMEQYTRTLHWNRQFFDVSVISESDPSQRAVPGGKYVALRELIRKTPAPIGGGPDGAAPSFVCHEWTMQYTRTGGVCVCVFSLVIPATIIKPDNPFGMTYWPYFYPKMRAVRYTYDATTANLAYSVVPLGSRQGEMKDIRESRPLSEVLKYAAKSALKELVTVRKRMRNYDPVRCISTYVKRVEHDVLVEEKHFRAHYNRLRDRYARDWVDSWHDTEVTDPIKFVYEEMAIAAYLLALWELEREREGSDNTGSITRQRFLDAGCGNGFLVYLLISEGHPGVGIDLQRRKIWDRYPRNVRDSLRHEEIAVEKFADGAKAYDWIIGNHSDELTPWLPIFAANAQSNVTPHARLAPRLFVLPCCFFDFDGRKLAFGNTRRTVSVPNKGCQGKYDQYMAWIGRICTAVGFEVVFENLRIPSTKYRAIVCTKAAHPGRMRPEVLKQLAGLVALDAKLTRG